LFEPPITGKASTSLVGLTPDCEFPNKPLLALQVISAPLVGCDAGFVHPAKAKLSGLTATPKAFIFAIASGKLLPDVTVGLLELRLTLVGTVAVFAAAIEKFCFS
jgi:hypothetical protein